MMLILGSALLLAVAPLSASTDAQSAPAQTTQQRFDAASDALARGSWAEAARLFEALESQTANNSRTLAIVRTRRATALFELGRLDEAYSLLQSALPQLPADDSSLAEDRFAGFYMIGRIAERRLDYAEAQRTYRLAAAIPVPASARVGLHRGLIQTQMFDDPGAAVRDADAAIAEVQRALPDNREALGTLYTVKGRALLSLGRHRDARVELQRALRLHGNLTTRVNYADIVNRNDLAMAALLVRDEADARRYLAYTGAGRFERGFLFPHAGIDVPDCGNGVTPQDVAVVEFSVMDDGTIGHALPVYASRTGPWVLDFARGVLNWSFSPDDIRAISPLFRLAARVELRCTERRRSSVLVEQQSGPSAWPEGVREIVANLPVPIARLRESVARTTTADDPRRRLAGQLALATHPAVLRDERLERLRNALDITGSLEAPPEFAVWLALSLAKETRVVPGRESNPAPIDIGPILGHPALRGQPSAIAMIRLAAARMAYRESEDARAQALLAEVRAMPADVQEPFRTEIAELSAALAAASGDMAGAQTAQAGITPGSERCRLLPRARRVRASSNDFPREAMVWGFEGWALQEPTIRPDGTVAQVRTVAAYPPFVFGEAAREIGRRALFEPMAGEAPCAGGLQAVRFMLPR